jgi:hypothetical protein
VRLRLHPQRAYRPSTTILGSFSLSGAVTRGGKRRQVRGGLGCLRCGGENRLLVGLQNGNPVVEILRMVGARLVGDAEVGAQERSPELGDKLFRGVGVIAEALAELPIAAALGAAVVAKFMKERGIVGLRRRARRRADEGLARGKVNGVGRGAVEGAAAAVDVRSPCNRASPA